MEVLFSCIADEVYHLTDLCIEITQKLDGKFSRKKYGKKIDKIFIYFICTGVDELNKFKSRFDKKVNYIILYTNVDKIAVVTYKNLDLKLTLGKYAIDKFQQFLTEKRFPEFSYFLLVPANRCSPVNIQKIRII